MKPIRNYLETNFNCEWVPCCCPVHLSNTFSLLSQRDAQGPFIHRETAEHERCRGSSCATGVPCDGGSLSADLLEEGE